ncbi:hypothetical protein [Lysinibacillus xylanilyticus]|uniref:hypothetical protein n=1 Tax=Lysinibacillus xylanilyticus TaxID=582475 RepID=UPI003D08FA67
MHNNDQSPRGNREVCYDNLNRLVRANLSDGNDVQLKYDAYDDIVFAKDNHTQVSFDYTILGSLMSREQDRKKVNFTYDTEEQLNAVINEKGESYQFERADLHKKLHRNLIEEGIPYRGRTFTGTADEFFEKATKAYKDIDTKGYRKIPYTKDKLFKGLTPAEDLEKLKELHSNGKIPCK